MLRVFVLLLLLMPVVALAAAPGEYVLGIGDKLRITVFGESDLSGEFEVSSTGQIAMPLIGAIPASGQTVDHVQTALRDRLADGYLRDPRVSIEVLTYRPFFILGEVMKPGGYGYVNGMTVVNAVALAGGYTYRADKGDIQIKRGGSEVEQDAGEQTAVQPGDVIRVPERFF